MKLIILGALSLFICTFANNAQAASISPETDTNALFDVITRSTATVGTDPRTDPDAAVQTSYFGFREANRTSLPETPFAPEMPRVEPRPAAAIPPEEMLPLVTRR